MLLKNRKKEETATWIFRNVGTDLDFVECTRCREETILKDEFPKRCPKCGAKMANVRVAKD